MNSLGQASFSERAQLRLNCKFEPGYSQGVRWIGSVDAQDELDRLCSDARARVRRSDPEGASFNTP